MEVGKKEVTEMLERLLAEFSMKPWQRNDTTLLEAADLMNRMYAYGVDKSEVLPCSKCGKDSTHVCNDTPNGGWGSMKCGVKLCDKCECGCTDVLVY